MISIFNDFIQNCNACTVGAVEEDARKKTSDSITTLPKGMTVIGYVRNRLDCGESSSGEEDTGKGDIAIVGEEQPSSSIPSTPSKNVVSSKNNSDNTSAMHHPTTPVSALRKNSNFASSPLLYRRDDSLMDQSHQSSLVSLSGTTVETVTNDETYTTPTSTPAKGEKKTITDENNNASSSSINDLSTAATTITLTPKSPMIELSLAKQVANETQLVNGNLRKTNREMLRNYRTTATTTTSATNNSNNCPTFTPPRLASNGDEIELQNMPPPPSVLEIMDSILPSSSSNNSSENSDDIIISAVEAAASAVVTRHYYDEYQQSTPPPLWTESTTIDTPTVHTELMYTYKYPRLYLNDPTFVIHNNHQRQNSSSSNNSMWWFELGQRMQTTLRHVNYDKWRGGAIIQQSLDQLHLLRNNNSICVDSSEEEESSFCNINTNNNLASSSQQKTQMQQQQQKQHGRSRSDHPFCIAAPQAVNECIGIHQRHSAMSNSTIRHNKSTPNLTTNNCLGGGGGGYQPGVQPKNSWSEPSASTMNIRGRTYLKDGIKVVSEQSMFSILGVDSFVSSSGNSSSASNIDISWATKSYIQRWNSVCLEVGLAKPPFLLIINFIVPWGNFLIYMTRLDADDGPYSSSCNTHPSEKVWKEFIEGTTEYRNEHFKLIPRICAGPWMVKKMVGSTPALIGKKLPTTYRGSVNENYLEIILDVTRGPAFGNNVANSVVGKADSIAVDIGFVIEGQEERHLPEQMLGLVRLHHLDMKVAPTHTQWNQELSRR